MFSGKVAFVTGAGQGIGKAIALALGNKGCAVCVNDIAEEKAKSVAAIIPDGRGFAVAGDVSNEAEVNAMVAACIKNVGKIDILVNNAGIIMTTPFLSISADDWDRINRINLRSVFLCCKAVLPGMQEQRYGKIVNIASIAGKRGGGIMGNTAYAATKGGVLALTKGIARETAPYGINVNGVAPGFSATEMTSTLAPEKREQVIRSVPMGRAATPDDISKAVLFLASDDAPFITGEIMDVDGGVMMD